jgi:hypothetical protein
LALLCKFCGENQKKITSSQIYYLIKNLFPKSAPYQLNIGNVLKHTLQGNFSVIDRMYTDAVYSSLLGIMNDLRSPGVPQVLESLMINPDGTPSVSYTGPGRNNGICSEAGTASSNSGSHSSGSHSSTSKAESACLNAVAKKVDLKPSKLSVIDVKGAEAGIGVTIRVPNVKEPWSCLSDKNGRVQGVSYTGSEGDL